MKDNSVRKHERLQPKAHNVLMKDRKKFKKFKKFAVWPIVESFGQIFCTEIFSESNDTVTSERVQVVLRYRMEAGAVNLSK